MPGQPEAAMQYYSHEAMQVRTSCQSTLRCILLAVAQQPVAWVCYTYYRQCVVLPRICPTEASTGHQGGALNSFLMIGAVHPVWRIDAEAT